MIRISAHVVLDPRDLTVTFVRASGPGGQNVNKVSTAAELRYDLAAAALPPEVKARLVPLLGSRLTKDGVVVIQADRFRSQEMNREDAVNRLIAFLKRAAERPKPRIATRPTLGSKARRLEGKARRSVVKSARRDRPGED